MIQSMTAYGRSESSGDWGTASCEIRSVNHRYLELSLHLPETLRVLEQDLRELISGKLKRGKVDCSMRYEQQEPTADGFPINETLLEQLIVTTENISKKLKQAATVNPLELLCWPGIIEKQTADPKIFSTPLLKLVEQTLSIAVASRQREGEKIKMTLIERCRRASEKVAMVQKILPDILESQKQKLLQRIQEIALEPDNDRLEQELLFLSQKMDVAEETDRLNAHLAEIQRTVGQTGPVGRRLDFLMQEMNREANTLGSKSIHLDTGNAAVELKVLIEQMREQVQNIE